MDDADAFILVLERLEKNLVLYDTFIKNFRDAETNNIFQIKSRLPQLEGLHDKYFNTYAELYEIISKDETGVKREAENRFSKFENNYFDVKSLFCEQLDKLEFVTPAPETRSKLPLNTIASDQSIRLPKIQIPEFNGELEKWIQFKSAFNDLIVVNMKLTNIQRFHYLNGVLGDKAKRVIIKIDISSDGFPLAWQCLCERFDNKVAIINTHINKMMDFTPITKATAESLQNLLDEFNVHLRSLAKLDLQVSTWDMIIINLVSKKLDVDTRSRWENEKSSDNSVLPTWEEMSTFLQKRCNILLTIEGDKPQNIRSTNLSKNSTKSAQKTFLSSTKPTSCEFCNNSSHFLTSCSEFLKLSPEDRHNKIRQLQLCINCLRASHTVKYCHSGSCKICHKKHHTLLHRNEHPSTVINPLPTNGTSNGLPSPSNAVTPNVCQLVANNQQVDNAFTSTSDCYANPSIVQASNQVLLSTAVVWIENADGEKFPCRALLDSASQNNFISSAMANKLKIDQVQVSSAISGLNNARTNISSKLSTRIASRCSKFIQLMEFLVVPEICNRLPANYINISKWSLPKSILLADPDFNVPKAVDILLGAEAFFHIVQSHQIQLGEQLPILRQTVFGYIVCGKIVNESTDNSTNFFLTSSQEENLDELLRKFWEIETCDKTSFQTVEEKQCEEHFLTTHSRDVDGRYIVRLPLKDAASNLGDSRSMALRRFSYLENKLQKQPDLRIQYVNFMKEYEALGHMKECTSNDSDAVEYFIPHHAVYKPTSTTTKVRVVFDASAKTTSKVSLNDILMTGPVVQQELFDIVLRFRKYQFVFTSDVEKMYRQIRVHQDDVSLQRIFWREKPTDVLKEYSLQTVTYGTSSAPYLATKTLQQLSIDSAEKFPLASVVASRDFYVDDLLSGHDDFATARCIIQQLNEMMSQAGMKLRKWVSNCNYLLSDIPAIDREEKSTNECIRTLGLIWNPVEDTLSFEINTKFDVSTRVTKRSILSDIAKIFDPLGFVAPVTVIAKSLLQDLWLEKVSWDDTLPESLQLEWSNFRETLPAINTIKLNRCVMPPRATNFQLHGFADASKKAYGACVYIRCLDEENHAVVNLLCSKSRISPLKTISIPRLKFTPLWWIVGIHCQNF